MYKWNLNSQHARTQQWHGGTVALIGGVVGMLLAGAFWWMRSTAKTRQYQLPQPPLNGRSYGFGDRDKTNKVSKRPLTHASLRCKRWLKPSALQRIPTPLNRC